MALDEKTLQEWAQDEGGAIYWRGRAKQLVQECLRLRSLVSELKAEFGAISQSVCQAERERWAAFVESQGHTITAKRIRGELPMLPDE